MNLFLLVILTLLPHEKQPEREDFFSLSLEELAQVKVVTASKSEVSQWDASAVMSVVTDTEIALMGANNLAEILDRIIGVQFLVSPGVNRVSVRGGEANQSVLHVLVLIDGRPLRTGGGNLSQYHVFNVFPVTHINRIEVIRGPGSSLYGTNAVEGVINIITRGGEEDTRVRGTFGSHGTLGFEARVCQVMGDWKLEMGTRYFDTDGWDYETPDPEAVGQTRAVPTFEDIRGTRLALYNDAWEFSVYGGRAKQFAFGENLPGLSYHSDVWLLDLARKIKLDDRWHLELHGTYNSEDFDWLIGSTPVFPIKGRDQLYEATLFGETSWRTSWTFGLVAQFINSRNLGGLVSTPFNHRVQSYSAYGQVRYEISEKLNILVGGQFNKVENFGDDLVPRFSANYRFGEDWGVNVFYGQAFRTPQAVELKINTPDVQVGNPDLTSERVETLDLQLHYRRGDIQGALTFYRAKQTDLIRAIPREDLSIGTFINGGQVDFEGIELETRYTPRNKWYVTASANWQENEERMSGQSISPNPNYSVKLGFGYIDRKHSIGLSYQRYGAFANTETGVISLSEPSQESDLVSLNLGITTPFIRNSKIRWELYATNLLDEQVRISDFLYNLHNSLPGYGDRAYFANVRVKF